MSKIITLSNLERFHGHLNFSGGSGYIKAIATNDTTGNIYVNTSDGKLYYKSNGTWSAITLYSSKPRAKNLVLRVSNALKYAGLVDPSDANASKIRVRVGNTIYAVETSNSAMWNGNASVENGTLVIPSGSYVYNETPITWGYQIEDDVEIYVKVKLRDLSNAVGANKAAYQMPYVSLVRSGRPANTSRINTSDVGTKPAVVYYELAALPYGGNQSIRFSQNTNAYSNNTISSGAYSYRQLAYNTTCLEEETEFKYIYDVSTAYAYPVVTSNSVDFDAGSNASLGTYKIWYGSGGSAAQSKEPTRTAYIAMGDMLSKNCGITIITDFYVKINNVTVLSFSDLINQFS